MQKRIMLSRVFIQKILNEKIRLFVLLTVFMVSTVQLFAADKYAYSAINWSAGPWYDAETGGNVTTAPVSGDNVFTNGFAVTVDADAVCDNLMLKVASVGVSVPSQLKVNNGMTLTVRGKIDGTNPPTASTTHVLYDATGTGTIKLTGAALTSEPYIIIGDNAIGNSLLNASGIFKPVNMVVEGADAVKVYQIGSIAVGYQHGLGRFTVKSGTILSTKVYFNFPTSGGAELLIEEGAEVRADNNVKGIGTASSKAEKITINGALKFTSASVLNAAILVIGNNGYLKTNRTNVSPQLAEFSSFWGNDNTPTTLAKYAVPTTVTIGTNGTVENAAIGATEQWIHGILPGTTTSIPYVNLKISGEGTKIIQSNLTVTGTLTIASGVTLVIPTGVTLTVASGATIIKNGTITINGTLTNNGTLIDLTTGLNSVDNMNAKVYVNSENLITIVAPLKSNYSIFNSVGQKISEGITKENQTTVSIKKGVYVVRISDNTKELKTKVIVR